MNKSKIIPALRWRRNSANRNFKVSVLLKRVISYLRRFFHIYRIQNWETFEYFDERWKIRIGSMAHLIDKNAKSVMDLGCGKCWLKDILPDDLRYIGVDYEPRENNDTIVCNFNAGEFPNIFTDVVFCSGILEYIEDLPAFSKKICNITNQIIISYCSIDFHPNLESRISLGWKNNLSNLEIINIFLENNFVLVNIDLEIPGHIILNLKRI